MGLKMDAQTLHKWTWPSDSMWLAFFLLFQVVEMDPTDNQDELMHDLIRDSTAYVAPEFDEDENDGSQFLNLHYHDDEDQDISGEDQDVKEAEV